jgi:hypothetical protein
VNIYYARAVSDEEPMTVSCEFYINNLVDAHVQGSRIDLHLSHVDKLDFTCIRSDYHSLCLWEKLHMSQLAR